MLHFKILIVSLLCIFVYAARPLANQLASYPFAQYKKDFGKAYASGDEESMREQLFEARRKEAVAWNAGRHLYKKGINHMSDWTPAELMAINGDVVFDGIKANVFKARRDVKVPETLDYRKAYPNVLTAVKDQGHCGSCWAHGAVEAIESAYALKTGKLFVLSQQQLTSCVANPKHCGGNGGCEGATCELGIAYAAEVGLSQEWVYAYESYEGVVPVCNVSRAGKGRGSVKPNGYAITNPRNDPDAVIKSLILNGPLAVVVDASNWHSYSSGIYDGCSYDKNITINHGVLLVGYGHDSNLKADYWIVRNSWSAEWGENGYIRVFREKKASCGWDVDWRKAGLGCDDDPDQVWTCGMCGILYDTIYAVFSDEK